MNNKIYELLEMKMMVDNEIQEFLEVYVPSSKMTKAGHIFQTLGDPFAGLTGYITRKDLDEKIVEWLRKNPNATEEDVQFLRDQARKRIRHNERIASAITQGAAGAIKGGAIAGPGGALAAGAASAILGPAISTAKHGIGALLRKTKTGQKSERDTNKRFLKVADAERKLHDSGYYKKKKDEAERRADLRKKMMSALDDD